jgi:hypothetical protein
VARAGVVARARVTSVRVGRAVVVAFLSAVRRAFGFAAERDVVRTLLFVLLCDAEAFNCFPFVGL